MGLERLTALVMNHPEVIHNEPGMKCYSGKVVVIDATARLLRCLTGPRESFNYVLYYFLKTLPDMESGVKPVYVFNGDTPSGKLKDQQEVRQKLKKKLKQAKHDEKGTAVSRYKRQLAKVKSRQVEDVKRLLWLLGVPFIDAPGEAAAQCASLVRAGHAFATVGDVVSLVYGSNILLKETRERKNLNKKNYCISVQEIHLQKVLDAFKLNLNEFIDLTILLGCDYSFPVKFIGPLRALRMIQKYRNIEDCLSEINMGRYVVPNEWNYKEARERYANPLVNEMNLSDVEWRWPDIHGVIDYMSRYYRFDLKLVQNALVKLSKTDFYA